ncbi:MAG: hypothetical protein J6T59_02480 [Bacteroidales bacterium]|nr:hypothetical protein [Bacteroidales bacterium]
MASFICISLLIIIPFFVGMVYFMYRYMLSKFRGVKERSYDLTGMIFLLIVFCSGGSSFVGRLLETSVTEPNSRMLFSLLITVVFTLATYVVTRGCAKRKVSREKEA